MPYLRLDRVLHEGWPQKRELDSEEIFIPKSRVRESKSLADEAMDRLLQEHICVILGSEGEGKTTLARVIAYKYQKEKKRKAWHVDFIEESGLSEDTVLFNVVERDANKGMLQVIENAHVIPKLWQRIEQKARYPRSYLLFTSRLSKEELGYKQETIPTRLYSDRQNVREYIEWYINAHRDNFEDSPYVPPLISPIDWEEDIEWAYAEFSSNLRSLTKCLEIWSPQAKAKRLHEVNRQEFLDSIARERFRGLMTKELSVLVGISSIYQYEVPAWSQAFDLDAVDSLHRKGLIHVKGDFCSLEHTSDARHNVEAQAQRSNIDIVRFILSYVKQYLAKDVLNYTDIIFALARGAERERIVARMLIRDAEVKKKAIGILGRNEFSDSSRVLSCVSWANRSIGKELTKYVVDNTGPAQLGSSVEEMIPLARLQWFLRDLSAVDGGQDFGYEFLHHVDQERILETMGSASLTTIRSFLRQVTNYDPNLSTILRRKISERRIRETVRGLSSLKRVAESLGSRLFKKEREQITPEDWVAVENTARAILASPHIDTQIKQTTIGILGKLMASFNELNKHAGTRFAEKLAGEISENVRLDHMRGRYAYDLEKLSLLVHHISNYAALKTLILRIVQEADLEALLRKEEQPRTESLRVIVWNTLKVDKHEAEKLVAKVDNSVWLGIVLNGLCTFFAESVWLLWNLYQADQSLCCALVRKSRQELASLLQMGQPMSLEALALLGLMELCGVGVRVDLTLDLSEITTKLGCNISLFALIFKYLSTLNRADADKLERQFREHLNTCYRLSVEDLVEQFPVPSSRQVLARILSASRT